MLPLPCAEPFNDSPLPSGSSKSLPNAHMPTRRFGWCGLVPSFPLPPRCVTSCALGAGTPWPPFRALNWLGPACHWASRQPLLHVWRILLVPPPTFTCHPSSPSFCGHLGRLPVLRSALPALMGAYSRRGVDLLPLPRCCKSQEGTLSSKF